MRVDAIEQREDQILATATKSAGNATTTIAARYVVGCDGARCKVRPAIGAVLQGDAAVLQAQTSVIRAPSLLAMMPGPAWAIDCINPRNRGLVFAVDGRQRWIVHKFAAPGATMSPDRERSVRDILGVGPSFSFETLSVGGLGRAADARRPVPRSACLSLRRCGAIMSVLFSSAMGGAVADDVHEPCLDVGGRQQGLGGPVLLDAYEVERRQ